ncbi:MAG: ferredoxin family protein [Peptococcaceae bacterium]|nr:ferredoxin family protein [Peptococcaceae bacterium]
MRGELSVITKIDSEKCIGCGVCARTCPLDTIRINENKKAYIAYPEDCMTCYLCEMNCPTGAIYVHPFKELLPRALENCY